MKREKVESSQIASIGYSLENKLLEVEFKNGAIYQYVDVTPGVHNGLMGAESKGKFFSEFIRDKYHTIKIKDG